VALIVPFALRFIVCELFHVHLDLLFSVTPAGGFYANILVRGEIAPDDDFVILLASCHVILLGGGLRFHTPQLRRAGEVAALDLG
jgi:MOSC domain-containing protein YiiM